MPVIETYAPNPVNPSLNEAPTIFLAGPIQGAPDWQSKATELIRHNAGLSPLGVVIANPRRPVLDSENFNYSEQVEWEKTHLRRAAEHGVIIFWYAQQDPGEPYEEGRPYAKTTFGEINRVAGWLDYNSQINVVVGIEPGFDGLSRRYTEELLLEKSIPQLTTLEQVAEAAVRITTSLG